MPLDELPPLGFQITNVGSPDLGPIHVQGFGHSWGIDPRDDVEPIVQEAKNLAALHDKLTQARDYFSENYQQWPTMTAQQKDAANRQAQRALANVCRRLLNDLTTPGD